MKWLFYIVLTILLVIIVIPFWFFAPYHHTERFIGQKVIQPDEFVEVPHLILENNQTHDIRVHYGTVAEEKYFDFLFYLTSYDEFTNKWYVVFYDEEKTVKLVSIESVHLNIDGNDYPLDIKNDLYANLQGLYLKKSKIAGSHGHETEMLILPLPKIPQQSFDLSMNGYIIDENNEKIPFSYQGEGVLRQKEHHWQRADTLIPW